MPFPRENHPFFVGFRHGGLFWGCFFPHGNLSLTYILSIINDWWYRCSGAAVFVPLSVFGPGCAPLVKLNKSILCTEVSISVQFVSTDTRSKNKTAPATECLTALCETHIILCLDLTFFFLSGWSTSAPCVIPYLLCSPCSTHTSTSMSSITKCQCSNALTAPCITHRNSSCWIISRWDLVWHVWYCASSEFWWTLYMLCDTVLVSLL